MSLDKKQIILEYYREQNQKRTFTREQKDRINERQRARYSTSEYYKQRIDCDCGGHYQPTGKYLHEKTKKHRIYLNI